MSQLPKKSERDKRIIEALVRTYGPISQVGLHELTNFRRGTISSITRELISEGKLLEVGRSNNPRGRKQVLLQLNQRFGFIVALQFDDEQVTTGILDLTPTILHEISESTCLSKGKEGLIQQLQSCVRRAIAQAGCDPSNLLGIGIADPGLVDSRIGVTLTSSTIDFWKQVPLKAIFEKEFGVWVQVESKTRAKTVAEQMLGAGDKQKNLIYLDYGTGIGAGIIVDGNLLYGENCGVGEVGHTSIFENGTVCKCGSIGCLEAIAGTHAIERKIDKVLAEGASSQIVTLAEHNKSKTTAWLVFQAANNGDKICGHIVSEVGNYIGAAVANLVNLFNPSIVVLDQRLALAGQQLLDQISKIVKGQALADYSAALVIRFGNLGESAGILGTGLAVLEKHFEVPAFGPFGLPPGPSYVQAVLDRAPERATVFSV
jgi:predicted NBD/HSP70 family sugar kinase